MKKSISILKLIKNKPSIALDMMVKGLLKQDRRKDFEVDMGSFGGFAYSVKICYGCAATCTIQQIAKKNFQSSNIERSSCRAKVMGIDKYELDSFETAIDDARSGYLSALYMFCKITNQESLPKKASFCLDNDNWKEQIPKVKTLILKLKTAGY